jgi:N-acylglucosamine 2-epimerase
MISDMPTRQRIAELYEQYTHCLLEDVLPFWMRHGLDREYGGLLTCLDRDGSVYNTDKSGWLNWRAVWMFSKLYNRVERRAEWLAAARGIFDFCERHLVDVDGRMFFTVTRDGQPLRKRRYLFTEAFGTIACAEYARATRREDVLQRARDTFRLVLELWRTPGALPAKVDPRTRVAKAHAMPMIMLATAQELGASDDDPLYAEVAEACLREVLDDFVKDDERVLLETVGPNGERLDSPEGRCVNPGHAIETAWFILREGRARNDPALIRRAAQILRWSLERGWDPEYGGILYFVDVEGKPPEQLEWDMKLWWPHTEALYALLLAARLTGEPWCAEWYERVHAWTFERFPDPEHGEWFGYLHRDGSRRLSLKGSLWKGPFHVPRALWLCRELLAEQLGPES